MTQDQVSKLHLRWFTTGQIPVEILHNWDDRGKTELLHHFVETKVVNDFSELFKSRVKYSTEGFSPEYDIVLENGQTVEVKISSIMGSKAFIEIAKLRDNAFIDSGLSLSRSDFYMFLQPDSFGVGASSKPVMKVRVIRTEELRKFAEIFKIRDVKTTRGFYLNFYDLHQDGWIGSYPFDQEKKEFNIMNPTLAHANIKKLQKEIL